jgi:hypothetical protein
MLTCPTIVATILPGAASSSNGFRTFSKVMGFAKLNTSYGLLAQVFVEVVEDRAAATEPLLVSTQS